MEQEIINALVGLVGLLFGWVLKTIWGAVRDLRDADTRLADKVAKIEVLVAGQYVTKAEFSGIADRIFTKLDGISEKLNTKADKP